MASSIYIRNENWDVTYDNFFYLLEKDNFKKNRNFLGEDLLQIQSVDNRYLIDVGWYPDFDPNRHFIIKLIEYWNWDDRLEKIGSDTPQDVIEIIWNIFTHLETDL